MGCLRHGVYDMIFSDQIAKCITDVLDSKTVRRSTAYISPTLTIKATAQRRPDRRTRQNTILVTIGAPNFLERRFIRQCQKTGEPFPVKNAQWLLWKK